MLCVNLVLGALAVSATYAQSQEENDNCTLSNGMQGKCEKISKCVTFEEDAAKGDPPNICSHDPVDSTAVVCCRPGLPIATTSMPTSLKSGSPKKRISEKMCAKYGELVYTKKVGPDLKETKILDCGAKEEPLITGGIKAGLKEFPHMVHIGFGEKSTIYWGCGGSLISDRWVLTAAHCKEVTGKDVKVVAAWARVGELNSEDDNDGAQPEILRIVEHRNHPEYNGVQLYNDIALFKLEKVVKFSPHVRPTCLQVDAALKSDSVIATGWGDTRFGGLASSHLLKVKLNVVGNKVCRKSYANVNRSLLPNDIDQSRQLCAGNEYLKDSCQGDSGGPLQYMLKEPYCMYSQVGVTSFGRQCGSGSPGIYSRVSFYVDWIESVVWPGQ